MLRIKCLITAGCSFSQVPGTAVTWPVQLRDALLPECVYYLGQGAAGNGVISKKLIHTVNTALQIYNPEEILVGVMWSGHDRIDIYSDQQNLDYNKITGADSYCNPVRINKDYSHYLINFHWADELTLTYLKYFYNEIGSYISTIEHILRTQWFLKSVNIPYFMTEYSFDCLPRSENQKNHSELKYLLDMIDTSYWLPVDNMWRYSINTGIKFPKEDDNHPSTEHHEMFTRDIILPWLLRKYLTNYYRP